MASRDRIEAPNPTEGSPMPLSFPLPSFTVTLQLLLIH
jgi:hypothetical protein